MDCSGSISEPLPSERHRLKPSFDSKCVAAGASASIDAKITEAKVIAERDCESAAQRVGLGHAVASGSKVSATRRPRRSAVNYSRLTGVVTKVARANELHHRTRPQAYPVLIPFAACMDSRDQKLTERRTTSDQEVTRKRLRSEPK